MGECPHDVQPEQWEAWRAAYPDGTWIRLEGGTLDIGIVREMTTRQRRLWPVLRVLWTLRLRGLHRRLYRWCRHGEDDLQLFAESWTHVAQVGVSWVDATEDDR